MIRTAPRTGYDTGSKRQNRRRIWRLLGEHAPGTTRTRETALMPSAEGDEVETATRNGFREINCHLIDDNPAIVAHYLAPRFPYAKRYGLSLSRAMATLQRRRACLSAAHWDMTGRISDKTMNELVMAALFAPFVSGAVVAVTIFRGREAGPWLDLMHEDVRAPWNAAVCERYGCSPTDASRMDTLGSLFIRTGWVPETLALWSYRVTSPMLTLVFRLYGPGQGGAVWNAHVRAMQVVAPGPNQIASLMQRELALRETGSPGHSDALRALARRYLQNRFIMRLVDDDVPEGMTVEPMRQRPTKPR